MRSMSLAILASIGLGFVSAASAEPVMAPMQRGSMIEAVQYGAGFFRFPRARGAIVDWCAVWANGCGWDGAHQFCRIRGFDHAVRWDTFNPGRTYVIGAHQYCQGEVCKGFRFVACE
jgi:hypothetical protein